MLRENAEARNLRVVSPDETASNRWNVVFEATDRCSTAHIDPGDDLDRFHVVGDVIDRVPSLRACGAYVKQWLRDKLLDHEHYIREHGDDMPEIRDWKWDVADGGAH
ncbi:MAG TPA: hypothetical protein VKV24_04295 [Casimicrobiaceae bacterium]|nr:hypothetical protein [Casimicrobiaceae bacterium]